MEVMVASVILVIIIGTVAFAMGSSLNLSRSNKNRTVAANLAQQDQDQIRRQLQVDFDTLSIGSTTTPRTVGKATYQVIRDTEWITTSTGSNLCDNPPPSPGSPSTGLAYVKVKTKVTWPNMGSIKPVVAETLITPPVKKFDQNTGHIPVQVSKDNGIPAGGVDIRVTAPNGTVYNQTTTTEGCAFFGFLPVLPAGQSYAVKALEPGCRSTCRATRSQSSKRQSSVGATAPPVVFTYDLAGALQFTVKGVDDDGDVDPTVPVPQLPLVLSNPGLSGQFKIFPATAAPVTLGNLFAFDDGYTAWSGACLDNDPQAYPIGRDAAPTWRKPG